VYRIRPLDRRCRALALSLIALTWAATALNTLLPDIASAEAAKPARAEDGKYFDKDGNPTYNITPDGSVDWATYSGYRRYHAECHVCHGPDGMGSTYAPALVDSLKKMGHDDFYAIVVQGRQDVNTGNQKVMPAFGTNPNVMCYLDDIYVYLHARADGALDRVRPGKHEDKPDSVKEAEKSCIGG
jgi:methanol metabolism-related c-type cytochrome